MGGMFDRRTVRRALTAIAVLVACVVAGLLVAAPVGPQPRQYVPQTQSWSYCSGWLCPHGSSRGGGGIVGGGQAPATLPPPPTPWPSSTPWPTFPPFPSYTPWPSSTPWPEHSFYPAPTPYQRTRNCTAGDLAVSVATDARSYPSGTTVHITLSVSNRSSTVCEAPDDRCFNSAALARPAALQNDIWDSRRDSATAPPSECSAFNWVFPVVDLRPGAPPHQVALPWSQRTCSNTCPYTQVPPGQYQIRGLWLAHDGGEADAPAVTIQITP